MALRVFPVMASGKPTFEDTWGAPRSGGRTHEGTDIFAPAGTPLLAVDGGRIFFGTSSLGGNSARLQASDGDTYIYTHLEGFEGDERSVIAGEVIGYVGNTGNAINTPPHVHFEVHPGGGEPVNPFPLLIGANQPVAEPAPPPVSSPTQPPLARAAGRAADPLPPLALWFWCWGRLLSARTSSIEQAAGAELRPTGEP